MRTDACGLCVRDMLWVMLGLCVGWVLCVGGL